MGRLKKGMNGPISGKVGTVIGSSWRGIEYMKSLPNRKVKFSKAELLNQEKFKLTQAWLKPIKNFVNKSFKNENKKLEGYYGAKSYISKNALVVDSDGVHIDPSLMKVSMGTLANSENITVIQETPKTLKFTWNPEPLPDTSLKDQVMLLAYDVANEQVRFTTTGRFRSDGSDELEILAGSTGRTLEIYAAFNSADRQRQSDSIYLGSLVIT
ncbi:DUF6266 family protein [Pedobacter sp. HMWF019]|uniref:DUF6266 family protein n=1 Tax=Pedobacter sp. HMWF019 TaxID=2056856 RepID=UPI0011B255A0|nr:DUF6266 family protein [Pedobacter sp. HMWF019]